MGENFSVRQIIVIFVAIVIAAGFGIFILSRATVDFSGGFCRGPQDFFCKFIGSPPQFYRPVGVMIENEIMARPFQQGLSAADIVYEAPTEGNITRFLAIFLKSEYLGKVGPVRSARPYFLDWMKEFGGLYAHVGGSDEALNRLWKNSRAGVNGTTSSAIFDVDQFFYEKYFWRENVRKTALEHTMFTTLEILRGLADEMNWDSVILSLSKDDTLQFDKLTMTNANEINIDFGLQPYRVKYVYDAGEDAYLRFQNGKPHIDNVKTVVIQRVKSWPLNDDKFRIKIETVGEGDALIFVDGRAVKAKWEKSSAEDKTRFFNENGDEIKFSFGKGLVWFEIVPVGNKVEYK